MMPLPTSKNRTINHSYHDTWDTFPSQTRQLATFDVLHLLHARSVGQSAFVEAIWAFPAAAPVHPTTPNMRKTTKIYHDREEGLDALEGGLDGKTNVQRINSDTQRVPQRESRHRETSIASFRERTITPTRQIRKSGPLTRLPLRFARGAAPSCRSNVRSNHIELRATNHYRR